MGASCSDVSRPIFASKQSFVPLKSLKLKATLKLKLKSALKSFLNLSRESRVGEARAPERPERGRIHRPAGHPGHCHPIHYGPTRPAFSKAFAFLVAMIQSELGLNKHISSFFHSRCDFNPFRIMDTMSHQRSVRGITCGRRADEP